MLSIPVQLVVGNEHLMGEIFSYAVGDESIIMRLSLVSKAWQQHVEEFAQTLLDSYSLNPRVSQFFRFPSFKKTTIGVIGEIYLSVRHLEKSQKVKLSPFPNLAPEINIAMLTLEQWGSYVGRAVELGYEGTVELLLASGPISEGNRSYAVSNAAKKGHQGIVELLLASGPISEEIRGHAVLNAAWEGRQRIVELLLANNALISEQHLGLAVYRATTNGHQGIVDLLKGREVSC